MAEGKNTFSKAESSSRAESTLKPDAWQRIAIEIKAQAPPPLGTYSHAIKAGPFLYLAGQGARDAATGVEVGITLDAGGNVVNYDIEAQTHAVIKNLTVVLESCNCTLENLIDVSVYLTDMKDFAKFNQVYGQYFSFAAPPTRTTVAVAALPGKNFIEIKAIALAN